MTIQESTRLLGARSSLKEAQGRLKIALEQEIVIMSYRTSPATGSLSEKELQVVALTARLVEVKVHDNVINVLLAVKTAIKNFMQGETASARESLLRKIRQLLIELAHYYRADDDTISSRALEAAQQLVFAAITAQDLLLADDYCTSYYIADGYIRQLETAGK
jgi:hypothetical protein